jgi:hypothetical protein
MAPDRLSQEGMISRFNPDSMAVLQRGLQLQTEAAPEYIRHTCCDTTLRLAQQGDLNGLSHSETGRKTSLHTRLIGSGGAIFTSGS